ncbi:unknown [Prevotella sp. CAG:255]|nr:unknown [Prevotella sp. CAG:255]
MKASVHHFFANVFVRTSKSSRGQNHGSRNGQTYCYCRRDDSRHKKTKMKKTSITTRHKKAENRTRL